MILTIWRHGQASMASSDRERDLTARGIEDIGTGAGRFLALCAQRDIETPQLILFSRWARTTRTAGILEQQLAPARCEPCDALIPGSRVPGVDRELARRAEGEAAGHVLLVSHQPLVSALVDHYLGEPGRVASLAPGGLACLRLDVPARACGELLFSAQPPLYEAIP